MEEKKYNVGLCSVCGNLIRRRAPADYAVCEFCYGDNPGSVVEVKLCSVPELLRQIAEKFFEDHAELRE